MRGWELILPGVLWLYVPSPDNPRLASGTWVCTLCWTVSIWGQRFYTQVVGVVKVLKHL